MNSTASSINALTASALPVAVRDVVLVAVLVVVVLLITPFTGAGST
ncbi:MAG: hypothetical protein ACRC2H_13875 [Silanimonas sp.]